MARLSPRHMHADGAIDVVDLVVGRDLGDHLAIVGGRAEEGRVERNLAEQLAINGGGELVRRDLKLRYKNSVGGIAWSLLNPLTQMAIFSVIFLYIFVSEPPVGDPSGITKLQFNVGFGSREDVLVYQRNFYFGAGGNTLFSVRNYQPLKNMFDTFHKSDTHTITLKQE